jgi:hypothetical protein
VLLLPRQPLLFIGSISSNIRRVGIVTVLISPCLATLVPKEPSLLPSPPRTKP